jgi:hypothetical protein
MEVLVDGLDLLVGALVVTGFGRLRLLGRASGHRGRIGLGL